MKYIHLVPLCSFIIQVFLRVFPVPLLSKPSLSTCPLSSDDSAVAWRRGLRAVHRQCKIVSKPYNICATERVSDMYAHWLKFLNQLSNAYQEQSEIRTMTFCQQWPVKVNPEDDDRSSPMEGWSNYWSPNPCCYKRIFSQRPFVQICLWPCGPKRT